MVISSLLSQSEKQKRGLDCPCPGPQIADQHTWKKSPPIGMSDPSGMQEHRYVVKLSGMDKADWWLS